MGKRHIGMPDDYDEEEFLLFMREEGDGRSDDDDDYEADELGLFLKEEGDLRGRPREQASRRKARWIDLLSGSRADAPAYPGRRKAAKDGKRSQRNAGIQSREKARLDQMRALQKEYEAQLSDLKHKRPKNKNSDEYEEWEEERNQLEEDLEELSEEIEELEEELEDELEDALEDAGYYDE